MPKKFPWNTSLDEILQSDSNVIVEDTGVGTVTINIDGSPVGVFSSTGLVVTGTIGGDVEHLKLSGATKVSAVGEGARITSSAGYLAELTYSGTEFRIESRLHGGTFKLQAESSGGSDRRILNADPDGNLDLYYPKDNVAVLTLTDVTGSGAYGVNMTGVSGNFGTWFFSGPTMAFTNQTAGGGMGFNAKQTGGAFVTGFYFDPDGPSKIVHPATDANILESLATGIIVGDGTVTSETLPITNGDTAQFKVTGNDLDIQVDQASGAINLLSSGAEVMLKATGDAAVALYYDGTVEGETVSGAFKATNGFQIASSGVTIDTIETTLTDDDTHFPTSGAVFDAISGFGAGDVVGPGSATDHAVARFNLATGKLIQDSIILISDTGVMDGGLAIGLGSATVNPGQLTLRGGDTAFGGGKLFVYSEDSFDTDVDFYVVGVDEGDLYIGKENAESTLEMIQYDASAAKWFVQATDGVRLTADDAGEIGFIDLEKDRIQFNLDGAALMDIAGDAIWAGLEAEAQLLVNLSAESIIHYIGGATEVLVNSSGLKLKTGAAVNEIETVLTDDDTNIPTSGAVFDAIAAGVDTNYDPGSLSDLSAEGEKLTMTVDVNATGFGAALYVAADFNLEEADADASATMPAIALALETGTGSKQVLLRGFIRNDSWSWSAGPIYIDTTTGAMTQTAPSGSGERVQRVGWAYSADVMFFDPDSTDIGVA